MQVPSEISSFSLEELLKRSNAEFYYISNEQQGFTLSNDNLTIEYSHFGPIPLVIDFLTKPHLRFESGVNPRNKSPYGIHLNTMYFLSSNPKDENSDCYILAETSLREELKVDDVGGNIDFYNMIKSLEELSRLTSEETFIEPEYEWFKNANGVIFSLLIKSNFYEVYDSWFKEFKFPRMSIFNRGKYVLGLPYKFK
ncbi:MAG: hypothetical protein ACOCP4_03450 [Candidatus Woesearchaeota archaeon]